MDTTNTSMSSGRKSHVPYTLKVLWFWPFTSSSGKLLSAGGGGRGGGRQKGYMFQLFLANSFVHR